MFSHFKERILQTEMLSQYMFTIKLCMLCYANSGKVFGRVQILILRREASLIAEAHMDALLSSLPGCSPSSGSAYRQVLLTLHEIAMLRACARTFSLPFLRGSPNSARYKHTWWPSYEVWKLFRIILNVPCTLASGTYGWRNRRYVINLLLR